MRDVGEVIAAAVSGNFYVRVCGQMTGYGYLLTISGDVTKKQPNIGVWIEGDRVRFFNQNLTVKLSDPQLYPKLYDILETFYDRKRRD